MKLLVMLVLITELVTAEKCPFNGELCQCTGISADDFLYEFHSEYSMGMEIQEIEIIDSNYSYLEYFPLPQWKDDQYFRIEALTIFNSGVKWIGYETFKDFHYLDKLNLSRNFIDDLGFLLRFHSDVTILDVSYCNLTTLNFNWFKNIHLPKYIDFSHNKIMQLNANFNIFRTYSNDYNNRENEVKLLNLSYNNLTSVTINPNYEFRILDLQGNKLLSLENITFINHPKIYSLNLSKTKLFNLTESFIEYVTRDREYDNQPFIVDVSQSSINIISLEFSSYTRCSLFNISHNHPKILIMKNLEVDVLDISHSHLKFIDSFDKLSIGDLLLIGNNFTEINSIPAKFIFTTVDFIDLSLNPINTIKKHSFSNLSTLRSIKISNTPLDIIEDEAFANLTLLVSLDLSSNLIATINWNIFSNLDTLKLLDISNNKLFTINANTLPDLAVVKLEGNPIIHIEKPGKNLLFKHRQHILNLEFTGAFPGNSLPLPLLQNLTFVHSEITTLQNHSFFSMYHLLSLNFNQSNIYQVEPEALRGLFNLETLDAQNLFKHTTTIQSGVFKDLKSLKSMNLSNLHMEELEVHAFGGLKNLGELLLNYNKLREISEGVFQGLGRLDELRLDHNQIFEVDFNGFSGLDNLEKLFLNNNNFKEISIGALRFLTKLTELHLEFNQIRSLHVGVFSQLESLRRLDLSNNNLATLNVQALFELTNLRYLNLEHNHLISINELVLLDTLKRIRYIGIGFNKWKCDVLFGMLRNLSKKEVGYFSENAVYNTENIHGIGCIDICKFVYCPSDEDEDNPIT